MSAHHLEISEQWQNRAADLTRWTADHLLNRTDRWRAYLPPRKRTPDTDATDVKGQLTGKLVGQHYAATKPGQLIAVAAHDGNQEPTTRFLAIQLARTGEDDPVRPGQNFQVALDWLERLEDLGFDPILEDADGAGTYRLLILFDAPSDAAQVASFGQTLVADYADRELHTPPSLIPRPADTDEHGNLDYLRLPGLHPYHLHHSAVWHDSHWLEGDDAIDALLATRATPATFIRKHRPKPTKRVHMPEHALAQAVTLPLSAPLQTVKIGVVASAIHAPPPESSAPTPASEEPLPDATKSGIAPAQLEESKEPPRSPLDYKDAAAASIAMISKQTGMREGEIVRRVFAWLADQDEVVQAVVLGQIPPAARPAIARQLLEQLER